MDGHFVPNLTFGPQLVADLRSKSGLIFDVHLMIEKPENFIVPFSRAGADIISVHVETCHHLHRTLQLIREAGVKPAVALNPATPLEHLKYVLNEADMVLLMAVNPGFGGQDYLPLVEKKITDLKREIINRGLKVDIEVDGGVNENTGASALAAGADILVAGSFIFKSEDKAEAIKSLKRLIEKGENSGVNSTCLSS